MNVLKDRFSFGSEKSHKLALILFVVMKQEAL
jgi:hypothetical protein